METIEQLLASKNIRVTAMRLLIYKFLAVCLTEHKIPKIKVPDGYVSENINLVIKGMCDKCSGQ